MWHILLIVPDGAPVAGGIIPGIVATRWVVGIDASGGGVACNASTAGLHEVGHFGQHPSAALRSGVYFLFHRDRSF